MTTSRPDATVSRRTALAGLGVGALGLALAARGLGASAQDATPAPTPFPMTDHPIVGVWQFDQELRQPGTDIYNAIFSNQGTYVDSSLDDAWFAIGTWRATGERTAELFTSLQDLVPQDEFAADYVPEGNVFEPGVVAHRISYEVDATGNSMTGTGMVEIYNADGTLHGSYGYEGIGTRMVVVPTQAAATPTP